MKSYLKKIFKLFISKFGYKLLYSEKISRNGINLNIGCGSYEIDGFISLDLHTEYYYNNKVFNRINYDMRKNLLPFASNTVDTIYCSHVIEHVETEFVSKFLSESYRVL